MSVATLRVGDLIVRASDKVTVAAKAAQGPNTQPVFVAPSDSLARSDVSAGRPLDNLSVESGWTSSQDGRMALAQDPFRLFSETPVPPAALNAELQTSEVEGTNEPVKTATSAPLKLELQSCPSFAEQSSVRSKPMWLERHQTLQRAYQSFVVKSGASGRSSDAGGNSEASDDLSKYLPSWDISRSQLWLMVEMALQQLPPQEAASSPRSHNHLHSQAHAFTHALLSSPFSAPHRPSIYGASCALPCVPEGSDECEDGPESAFSSASASTSSAPDAPLSQPSSHPQPHILETSQHEDAAARVLSTHASIPVQRMLSRARSIGRTFLKDPLGLGPSPLSRGPSLSLGSLHPPSSSSETCPNRRSVAFAAGLAAATSTAAAVSHAASVATSGMAGMAPLGASGLLGAGANMLVDQIQNHVSKRATTLVAEVIMGSEAPHSAREQMVQRVQATLAGLSVMWFMVNLHGMSDSLAHLDFENDFATSAKLVLDLVTSGPSLLENCRELMQIGVAVGMGLAKRNGGGAGDAAGAILAELGGSMYSDMSFSAD